MWEVVKRTAGETEVSPPAQWTDAYADYEKLADRFNKVDKAGNYTHPDVRVSIRKFS